MVKLRFLVFFRVLDVRIKLSYGLTHEFGLDFLDYLKHDCGLDIKSLDEIELDTSCSLEHSKSVVVEVIDNDIIRKIPQFRRAHECTVFINKDGYLGQFYKLKIEKKVERKYLFPIRRFYCISFELDKQRLINHWIKDGCPQYWPDVEKEELEMKYFEFSLTDGHYYRVKAQNLLGAINFYVDLKTVNTGRGGALLNVKAINPVEE